MMGSTFDVPLITLLKEYQREIHQTKRINNQLLRVIENTSKGSPIGLIHYYVTMGMKNNLHK